MISSSKELQQLINGELAPGNGEIAPGDYHIHGNTEYRTLHLVSYNPYAIRVFVHDNSLLVGGNSYIRGVTFYAMDDLAIMQVDHSSRATINDNFFNASEGQNGNSEVEFLNRFGILTTDKSNSEDNWNVRVSGNEFRWFKAGIKVSTPSISPIGNRLKGTSKWMVKNNGFDGCEIGLDLTRPELFYIEANHFQLHRVGIQIQHGHTNWLMANDFERGYGNHDIFYDKECCNNLAIGNTPPDTRISEHVHSQRLNNFYLRRVRKLNIWADCNKGEDNGS